jgi:predicted amidohydrolase YtcJ
VNETADLVAIGGRIVTRARSGDLVEAIAVRDGRVVAAGGDADIRALADGHTVVVDLGGRTVIPGLIDSHMHAVRAGLTWTLETRWDALPTLEAALDALGAAARDRPPGSWVCVLGGWHPGQFAEDRLPTRADLELAVPHHPAFVQLLYDGAVLNTAALRAAALEDADGTGWVAGMGGIQRCMQAVGEPAVAEQREATRTFFRQLARWGLTGVVDAGGFGMTQQRYRPLFDLREDGALPLRVRLYVGAADPGDEEDQIQGWLEHIRSTAGDEHLATVGIGELAVFDCHDGEGLQPRPFPPDALQRLEALTRVVAAEGRSLQLHAILDASAQAILDVWERVGRDHPLAELRFSLAHVEQASEHTLRRARALGVGIGVQNRLSLRASDTADAWGADRLRSAPSLRTMLDLGIPVGGGTDSTRVAPPNPWHAIRWMVGGEPLDGGPRRDPAQCLSVREALETFTAGSAWFSGEDRERGRLEPGYRADFAVLSDDCLAADADALAHIESLLTVVGGTPVHASSAFAGLAS